MDAGGKRGGRCRGVGAGGLQREAEKQRGNRGGGGWGGDDARLNKLQSKGNVFKCG